MRNNRLALFALFGFLGGAAGSLLAELAVHAKEASRWENILGTAVWFALAAGPLSLALLLAIWFHNRRRELPWKSIGRAVFLGALAGAVAGAIAELVFQANPFPPGWRQWFFKPLCWGLAGCLLGLALSWFIPNLGRLRGALAGALGGLVGGYGFVTVSQTLPDTLGRLAGLGVLGAALGLALVAVELLFRQAALDVIWGPKERTTFSLGEQAITLGGGDDHIHVPGLPDHAGSVVFDQGRIQYRDRATGQVTPLRDGSRITIGRIELQVRASR